MTQELKTYSRAMNALLGRKYMISAAAYEAVLILLSVLFTVIFAIGTLTETADDFGLVVAAMSIMGSFSQITFVSFAAQIYPVMFMPSGKADAINDEATRKAFGGCSTVRGISDLMPVDRTLLVKGFRRRMFVSAYALCASVICSGVFSVIGGCFGKESTFFCTVCFCGSDMDRCGNAYEYKQKKRKYSDTCCLCSYADRSDSDLAWVYCHGGKSYCKAAAYRLGYTCGHNRHCADGV